MDEVEEEGEIKEDEEVKIKKYDHIPVRPETFAEFRSLKNDKFKSDNAFILELIKWYKLYLRRNGTN